MQSGFSIRPRSVGAPRVSRVVLVNGTEKGSIFNPKSIEVRQALGHGSFGEVFEGLLKMPAGDKRRVVLKRIKAQVKGAELMGQMEHRLNVVMSKKAPESCAPFVGYCEVERRHATFNLTTGLWLLWEYKGANTLWHYLHKRDGLKQLAAEMGVPYNALVPTVMKNILECLRQMHEVGLVHRDVKPANLIFCEDQRRFRLIDLGACADLRSGTNYVPDESILDPIYCAPEQYILPTDSPDLASTSFLTQQVASHLWWARFKPDRFDIYSAGLVMLQMSVPSLRTEKAIKAFRRQLGQCSYNFRRWRRVCNLPAEETEVLDTDNFAGWHLLEKMLMKRDETHDANGNVHWKQGSTKRIGAEDALRDRFVIDQAVEPGILNNGQWEQVEVMSLDDGTGSLWQRTAGAVQSWLSEMELRLKQQESTTRRKRRQVQELETKVERGEAPQEQLQLEQKQLEDEEVRLEEMKSAARKRVGMWAALFSGEDQGGSASIREMAGDSEGFVSSLMQGFANKRKEWKRQQEEAQLLEKEKEDARQLLVQYLMRAARKADSAESYADLQPFIPHMVQLECLTEQERASIFLSYKQELKLKLDEARKEQQAKFTTLMTEVGVMPDSNYADFHKAAHRDPRFTIVPSEEARKAYFFKYLGYLSAQGSSNDAEQLCWSVFHTLTITRNTTWMEVNRHLFADPRLDVLSMDRKKVLFEEYQSIATQLADARAEEMTLSQQEAARQLAGPTDVHNAPATGDYLILLERIRVLEQELSTMRSSAHQQKQQQQQQPQEQQQQQPQPQKTAQAVLTAAPDGSLSASVAGNGPPAISNGAVHT